MWVFLPQWTHDRWKEITFYNKYHLASRECWGPIFDHKYYLKLHSENIGYWTVDVSSKGLSGDTKGYSKGLTGDTKRYSKGLTGELGWEQNNKGLLSRLTKKAKLSFWPKEASTFKCFLLLKKYHKLFSWNNSLLQ